MKASKTVIATFLAAATLMGGCASTDSHPVSSASSSSSTVYGVIDAIEVSRSNSDGTSGSGIGAGTVIGGVVGGVLGHQVGGGTGKDVATVAGVVGGAMVGHQLEKGKSQQQDTYRITVRLDNGWSKTVTQTSINDMRVGDRVRIDNEYVSRD